jgi:hypothetical protein
MHEGLGKDLIDFAEFAIEEYGLKIPENHPLTWSHVLKDYKRKHYISQPGMIYLNYTIAEFFNQDPIELRELPRFPNYTDAYCRRVAMYFMSTYNHRGIDIAVFYNVSKACVSQGIMKIRNVLNNGNFDTKKVLQVLKYEIL